MAGNVKGVYVEPAPGEMDELVKQDPEKFAKAEPVDFIIKDVADLSKMVHGPKTGFLFTITSEGVEL